ncbi:hypothetical protein OIO90_002889 [Microbotryomycetes sp. JL221]|nr:hypothetical protein OIO90_002889 [Microbotryomycetes sp. JL221]
MLEPAVDRPHILTLTSVVSLLATVALLLMALCAARFALPRRTSTKDTLIFVWLAFDALTHLWGFSDPTVVSLELLTVFGAGPLCVYLCYLMAKQDRAREYWMVVLCTAEIYGGWMTFVPEWITGSHNLRTDNFMHKWIYLAFFNGLWVIIPLWLLWDSWGKISTALRATSVVEGKKKR